MLLFTKWKVLFYIFIYHGRENQTFKISYLFYITKMILNEKNKIIVQYKNIYSLEIANCGLSTLLRNWFRKVQCL